MKICKLVTLFVMLSLTACSFEVNVGSPTTSVPTPTIGMITETPTLPPTAQSSPTTVIELPSPTPMLPTQTSLPRSSSTPVPIQQAEQNVSIFLIALEDNGQSGSLVGCGDSAIPVTVTIPQTQGVLRAALEKLLSARQQFYGESGLYNSLYQSDLQVAEVTIEQGTAIIHLTGTIRLGGSCDAPRLKAQIEQTALQFSTVSDVAVFVNETPLEEVLSQK